MMLLFCLKCGAENVEERLVPGAGVFLRRRRKSQGSVLPGFLQFPVHTGG